MFASTCVWTGGGDNELGGTLMTLKDDPWPLEKVKRQIRRDRGITNRPPTPGWLQVMHILQEFGIISHENTPSPSCNWLINLTLLDGAVVRDGSSYAATFSHVATTTCVGVNLESGKPRCTSWMSTWIMNEWGGRGKDGVYNEGWTESGRQFLVKFV